MVLSHIFFNNILIISLMLILCYFGSRGLLTWSEYLSREYENELDTFIPVTRPVTENKWLMLIAAIVPLICVAIACHLYGIQYPIILYVFAVSLFMVQFSLTDFLWQVIFDKQLALFAILGISRLLVTGDGLVDCLVASVTGFVAFFLPSRLSVIVFALLACFSAGPTQASLNGVLIAYFAISSLLSIYKYLPPAPRPLLLFLGRNSLPLYVFSPIFTVLCKQLVPYLKFDPTGLLFLVVSLTFCVTGSLLI